WVKRVEAQATPSAPPVRAVVAVVPEAAPILSVVTEPRMALWFGVLNRPQPRPQSASGKIMLITEEWGPRNATRNCPTTMMLQPTVQSKRDPTRSEREPAMGAVIMMMTESAMISQPTWAGEKPMMF